jgi:hypothetical protein
MATKRVQKIAELGDAGTSSVAFDSAARLLRAAYQAEIDRLADFLSSRIRAGEFSGHSDEGPRYLRLVDELRATHPWLQGVDLPRSSCDETRTGRLVFACSRWFDNQEKALRGLGGWDDDPAEAMAHDTLAVAAARGWVKPMRYVNCHEPYALLRRRAPDALRAA